MKVVKIFHSIKYRVNLCLSQDRLRGSGESQQWLTIILKMKEFLEIIMTIIVCKITNNWYNCVHIQHTVETQIINVK